MFTKQDKLSRATAAQYTRELLARNGYEEIEITQVVAFKEKWAEPSFNVLFTLKGWEHRQMVTVWLQDGQLYGEW